MKKKFLNYVSPACPTNVVLKGPPGCGNDPLIGTRSGSGSFWQCSQALIKRGFKHSLNSVWDVSARPCSLPNISALKVCKEPSNSIVGLASLQMKDQRNKGIVIKGSSLFELTTEWEVTQAYIQSTYIYTTIGRCCTEITRFHSLHMCIWLLDCKDDKKYISYHQVKLILGSQWHF